MDSSGAVAGSSQTSCTSCKCNNNSPGDFEGFSSSCAAPQLGQALLQTDPHTISLTPSSGLTVTEAYAAVSGDYQKVRILLSDGTFLGGISIDAGSSVEVIGAGVSSTVWDQQGGGRHIYSEGEVFVQDLTMANSFEPDWCGGSIQLWQTTTATSINNVVFSNCTSQCGGAIDARTAGPLLMIDTSFEGNTATMDSSGAVAGSSQTSCTSCTCSNNSPGDFDGFSSACAEMYKELVVV